VLQHLDDRSFAVEKDPRSPGGQGYTGLEALLNYVYYQATSTTLFDANNHLLNIDLFASLTCSPYPDPQAVAAAVKSPGSNPISGCRSWLGPSQPGITTPDPTATTAARARKPAATAAPAPPAASAPAASGQPAGGSSGAPSGGSGGSGGGATGTPSAGLPSLDQLVGNLVQSLPNLLPSTLGGLLGQPAPAPSQRSVARSQKQLLDYLLAP
jgi:hypothetical protein